MNCWPVADTGDRIKPNQCYHFVNGPRAIDYFTCVYMTKLYRFFYTNW